MIGKTYIFELYSVLSLVNEEICSLVYGKNEVSSEFDSHRKGTLIWDKAVTATKTFKGCRIWPKTDILLT